MKNQYFGDINDYRKYSLLRQLGGPGVLQTVVCWALTEGDGRSDGNRIRYLESPELWRGHDPEVFDCLRDQVVGEGRRRVSGIEEEGVIPNCRFFYDILSDNVEERGLYFERLTRFAHGADLLFLDPDNGLGVKSVPRGRRNSSKYVYWDEVAQLYGSGMSLLIYQHFPRVDREEYIGKLLRVAGQALGVRSAISFRTSHVVFLLFPQPKHHRTLGANARQVLSSWHSQVQVGFHTCFPGSTTWDAKSASELDIRPCVTPPALAAS